MTHPSQPPQADQWRPPSDFLRLQAGLWRADLTTPISYPESGNETCLQVEDDSYWFRHRMNCLRATIRHHPPAGTLYDIGGGNGFVALGLQSAGVDVVLVEPGSGARNALRRGVRRVIHSTLEDARFHPHSLPAAGAFDVVEHIADDTAFLLHMREQMVPGGRFYCTVPAFPALWSEEDVHAGHFRRYTRRTLGALLARARFTVEFISYFFTWLTLPVAACRALPSRLHLQDKAAIGSVATLQADHRLPAALAGLVGRVDEWELARVQARRPLPFGTSLLCVARADHS